jgi:energy-coupling factor transporter ATP-binding protein EcfA2
MNKEDEKLSWLFTPASSVLTPPVETCAQTLPFDQLSWKDFEKLCYRLIRLESNIEHCQQYGVEGEEQHGIDIYARVGGSEKYRAYQCKNEKDFGPAKISSAVEKFISGEWLSKSDSFVLCTRESLRQTNRAEELEKQAKILEPHGVTLLPWDEEELCSKLKLHPEIVDDFFGRAWVKAFCGADAANRLGERLDAVEIKKLRTELFSLYNRVFNIHDRGIPLADALPLINRYIIPDIEDTQMITASASTYPSDKSLNPVDASNSNGKTGDSLSKPISRRYSQRLPIQNWIAKNKRSLLFGEPGSGKSTFLRFLALDILNETPTLEFVAEKWGASIPVWIPFALWTKVISQAQANEISVRGILKGWLKSWDAEQLIPLVEHALKDQRLLLLIDGLDEHSSNDSARIALNHLESFLGEKDVSVIATTRPHGFEKLGMKVADWQQAKMADFSIDQQQQLTSLWFEVSSKRLNPDLDGATLLNDVQRQTHTFFAELERSNELRELARNPLLLCLLISFQLAHIRLPLGRFEAYAALTSHLISIHPQARRVASDTTAVREPIEEDVKTVLAHLAFHMHKNHPEGLISEEDAAKVMVCFLVDDQQGLGMTRPNAVEMGRTILSRAEDTLGILVKRSQDEIGFYHRTIQEYLASYNISRLPFNRQKDIIVDYCADPLWREVILGLFQIIKRPDDVRSFIQSIQARKFSIVEKQTIDDLLCEVVFGHFNCPPSIARALAQEFFKLIEHGTWMPQRERLLCHVLDGLRSTIMGPMVKEKIQEWFPDRLGWDTAQLFQSMASWDLFPDLLDALFKGLNAEEYRVKVSAAFALSRVAQHDVEVGNRLADLANHSDDPYQVAAAMEGLISGWPDHPALKVLAHKYANCAVPIPALVAICGRIALNCQTHDDLNRLLKLASQDSRLYLSHNNQIARAFIIGWPKSERIKKVCLRSFESFGPRREAQVQADIAVQVLLEGYPQDEDVVSYCVNELKNQKYPFNVMSFDAFSALARNFRDNPRLITALDSWVQKQGCLDVQVSVASLVARTEIFKKRLIEDLHKSLPHWPASALLEGWGMNDPEVSAALLLIANGPAGEASDLGYLIPKIIADRSECRRRLIEVFKDPNCKRYDFVLSGFVEMGDCEGDTELVDMVLPVLEKAKSDLFTNTFRATFFKYYSFDPRVRRLALDMIEKREAPLQSIASSFGNDAEVREKILMLATPLPTPLRQMIAAFLGDAEIDDNFAKSILKLYDNEKDREIKVQSSIGYHTRLKSAGDDPSEDLKVLAEAIVCAGPDHEERRLAAFCGLTILGRLDVMTNAVEKYGYAGREARIRSIAGLGPNVPHIRFVLKNWEALKRHFQEEFWLRLFDRSSEFHVWNELAGLAAEYPAPRQEVIDFLLAHNPKIGRVNSLSFLSRVRPLSNLTLEYCLTTLGFAEKPVGSKDPDQYADYRDKLTAAEILGEQFGNSEDVLRRIDVNKNKHRIDDLILVLSEGWPESRELNDLFDELTRTRGYYYENTKLRFHSSRASMAKMYLETIRLIRVWSSDSRYWLYDAFIKPLVRRLQRDDKFVSALMRHLDSAGRASDKISIPKLLYKAKGLTPELKTWAERELDSQLSGNGVEAGLDITTGEYISVPHAIYEMLRS